MLVKQPNVSKIYNEYIAIEDSIIKMVRIKLKLYEKSHHKGLFLKEVSKKLNLDTEVIKKNIFELKKIKTGSIMARAFKPLPIILNLAYENFEKYENLILFMGKSGEETLKQTLVDWDLDYEKKKSLTSKESFLLNIKNIRKKNYN